MAYINLHLHSNQELTREQVVDIGLMFNPKFPTKWLPTQLRVLDNVLCNLVKYQNENKILFHKRNEKNLPPRYNPLQLGHRVMIGEAGVLAKLKKAKLIKIKTGDNTYKVPKEKYDAGYKAKTSEFKSLGSGTLEFARLLGITRKTIQRAEGTHHVILKKPRPSKTLVDYTDSKLSLHIEALMSEYCDFLNTFSISCDGEKFTDILLRRSFRDLDGDKSLKYGSRSGGYWHDLKRPVRPRTIINRQKTAQLDFVSSQMNILYCWKYETNMSEEDQYDIKGFKREMVKVMTTRMLNNYTKESASGSFKGWLNLRENYYYKTEYEKNPFPLWKLQKAIREKHSPVAHLFYNKKIGMNLQFLEASLIFEIAVQLCRRGIPALTVHDEIIVPRRDEGEAKMVMYSTYIDRKLYKALF
jgi:hypothetical protein